MKTRRKQSLALASISLAALFGTASCNALLGIDGDEYRDVAVEMCGCEGIEQAFSNCQSRVRDQLAQADADDRERWLGEFDTRGCGSCGDPVAIVTCLQTPPVCRKPEEKCGAIFDCCGVLDERQTCIDGRCTACIPPNDPGAPGCTANTDCCGGVIREGEVYCHEGRCVQEAAECRNFVEACDSEQECCGIEANSARCFNGGCFEFCLAGESNCPKCCAKLSEVLPGFDSDRICVDGQGTAASFAALVPVGSTLCDIVCVLGEDEDCPTGMSCKEYPLNTQGGVQLCLGPDCPAGTCPEGFSCFPVPVREPQAGENDPPAYEYPLCFPNK